MLLARLLSNRTILLVQSQGTRLRSQQASSRSEVGPRLAIAVAVAVYSAQGRVSLCPAARNFPIHTVAVAGVNVAIIVAGSRLQGVRGVLVRFLI